MAKHPTHRRWVHHTYAYRGKSSGGFHLPRPVSVCLIAAAVLAVVLAGIALYLQRYMVYSRDGGTLVLPGDTVTSVQSEEIPLTGLSVVEETAQADPQPLRALELSIDTLLEGNAVQALDEANANALILDMKPISGTLFWNTSQASPGLTHPVSPQADAVEQAVAQLRESGVYLIARVHLFRDDALSADPALLLTGADGSGFTDADGAQWLDPSSAVLQENCFALAKELTGLGFSELLICDGGYPADPEGILSVPEGQQAIISRVLETLARGQAQGADPEWVVSVPRLSFLLSPAWLANESSGENSPDLSVLSSRTDRIWCTPSDAEGLSLSPEETQALVLTRQSFSTEAAEAGQAILLSDAPKTQE